MEYRLARFGVAATFLLLIIGGMVNPTGSSLACPEPTLICHGSILPPMTGGVLYEHGHRLFATSVGLLQLAVTILVWRRRPALRWLVGVALGMIAVQATLGALTVAFKLPPAVSTFHLVVGFSYFATTLLQAFKLRPQPAAPPAPIDLGRARRFIAVATGAVFAQIVLGGLVRHLGASLACVDLPLCGGQLYPDGAPTALIVHMTHRLVGVIVAAVVLVCAIGVWRNARGVSWLRRLAVAAPLLVAVQITLGVLTVYTLRSTPVAVAHFAGAASLWATWVAMWLVARSRGGVATPRRPRRVEAVESGLELGGAHARAALHAGEVA